MKMNDSVCSKPCPGDPLSSCGDGSSYNGEPEVIWSVYGTGRPKMPINGSWSVWTGWSSCLSNCRNSRNRTCNNPSPMFGGLSCSSDFEAEDSSSLCYGGECCPGILYFTKSSSAEGIFLRHK